ncbi:hypothetical protein CXQ85_004481 [Candidozyma haemuli]|uniref:DNA repair protein RAD50 n=1 Tax=Candidozyma haemuli TaxID=45357 RepID=A0A2V1AT36_9ASCO|nr:hypothetical protein CXQ85_004481 [[Candida] haemuloni]PVH20965.1 hypothetical protein CXQ85_004481 [[Candida] haemuloni]
MSSLYKLSISGVRSFSPKDNEIIQFGAPLTLICGQNGCGKTTVIECLKYATTGDLPPNSKGGAFVNDPAVADRSMVNAEIKLGFISVDNKSMTVTRNMQLTRKRTGRSTTATNTFKTLEGQLAVHSQGRKTSISTKNAELDTRVPQYLGASKAVLEYVIFCHQEDSLWPLSEASVLKKRFDEIFEASKFTKVLDNLKVINKEMTTDIKLLEQSVSHANLDKKRASKIKEKVSESRAKVEQYNAEIADLNMEIEGLEKQADDLFHSNQSFQKTLSEHERLKMVYETTETNFKRLGSSIDVLRETDDELRHQLANFAQIQSQKMEAVEEKELLLVDLDGQQSAHQESLSKLTRDEGILFSKREAYEERKLKLSELSEALQQKYSISRESLHEDLKALLSQTEAQYEELVENNRKKLDESAAQVKDAEKLLSREEQHKNYGLDEIKSTKAKLKEYHAKISSSSANEDNLTMENAELESLQKKLSRKKDNDNTKELSQSIQQDTDKLHNLENDLDDLMRKITTANKQADLFSKLDLLKDSSAVKEEVLSKSIQQNQDSFEKITGKKLADEGEAALNEVSETTQKKEHEQLLSSKSLASKLDKLRANEESDNSALKKLEKALSTHTSNILKVIEKDEISQYEELVKEAEEDYNTATYNLNTFDVTKSFKVKAIEIAKQSKCCTLCNRGFSNTELDTFIKEVQQNVNNVTAKKLQEDVDATKKDLDSMKAINYDVLQYRSLTTEVANYKKQMESRGTEMKELQSQHDEVEKSLEETKSVLSDLNRLRQPIINITRLRDEISHFQKQIDDVKSELDTDGASTMTMAELQKLQQERSFEVKRLRQSISNNTDERDLQLKELSRLEGQIKDKELSISNLKNSMNELVALKSTIAEAEERVASLEVKQKGIDKNLQELEEKLANVTASATETKNQCSEEESEMHEKHQECRQNEASFRDLQQHIKTFEEQDLQKVEENTQKIGEVREKISVITKERKALDQEMSALKTALNDAAKTKRNIEDNIEYRNTEQELDSIRQQIEQLDVSNAEVEKETYQAASKKLRDQINELNGQHFGKAGEVKQINDQIQQLQQELNSEFKDVEKMYHKEWIKLQTNMLVSKDLQTYSSALDNAIMKYHSMKMDQINKILRELWNQTYKGTDIDRIEIKCDVNTSGRGRSYNYRVVMYKKSSELDMRGRCSAGQKVLTSILIRLALAECFGTNCGMIALDEPTTNLDTENAESLATALNTIIDVRKNQKNFQLIVITHDEKFLSHINA